MRRICVYCGSNIGRRTDYAAAAPELADALAARNLELVYGGAQKGIMGVLADAVLATGGRVHGVIPTVLADAEVAHEGLTQLHVVDSMHERKTLMADLSDAFVAMPGGFGTIDEMFEILTWGQLRIHDKPCGLLNVGGYFDGLLRFLDHAVTEGFLRRENRDMLLSDADANGLLRQFDDYVPPRVSKWTD